LKKSDGANLGDPAPDRLLRSAEIQPGTYSSPTAFLADTKPPQFDCLAKDIHLGGMSGMELQRWLVSAGEKTPAIFITAQYDSEIGQDFLLYRGKSRDTGDKSLVALLEASNDSSTDSVDPVLLLMQPVLRIDYELCKIHCLPVSNPDAGNCLKNSVIFDRSALMESISKRGLIRTVLP
jgi:CheY-like chemotaxis protein